MVITRENHITRGERPNYASYCHKSYWPGNKFLLSPVNNVVIVPAPHFETVTVSWRNMSNYMNLLTTEFSTL
jgi:hypothetical protein